MVDRPDHAHDDSGPSGEPSPQARQDAGRERALGSQLRQYADAVEAHHRPINDEQDRRNGAGAPIVTMTVPAGDTTTRRLRQRRPLAVAAVAALVAGAVGLWALDGGGGDEIDTSPAGSTESSAVAAPAPVEPGDRPNLLPDPDQWVVVEHYTQSLDHASTSSVQAWEHGDAGLLILVVTPAAGGVEPPLADAVVEASNNRAMLVWGDGDRFSLQGIDVAEADLLAAATSLHRTGDGWELDGAALLAAAPVGTSTNGEAVQIDLAPAGDAIAGNRGVTSFTRPGPLASLYGELHEASSLGVVSERMIAGHPGYLIEGPDTSYALVAIDGWVTSWQVQGDGIDLAGLLDTVTSTTGEAWEMALAAGEQARVEAIAEAAAATATDGGYVADLPRYVLPDPWQAQWVTDLGLWTDEQHAQRRAIFEANTGDRATDQLWTQGFAPAGEQDDPLVVPTVMVTIEKIIGDFDRSWLEVPTNFQAEPYQLAGLDGYLREDGVGSSWWIVVADDEHVVNITTTGLSRDELRSFADSLEVRPGGLGQGFTSTGPLTVSFDQAAPSDPLAVNVTFWLSAWTGPDGRATVKVEDISPAELQSELHWTTTGQQVEIEVIEAGPERILYGTTTDWEALAADGDSPSNGRTTSVGSYSPATGRRISVSVTGTRDDALDLLDSLIEVDLDTWRELVEPINADPLHPR